MKKKILDEFLRVDHAGERAAQTIYKGQIAALAPQPEPEPEPEPKLDRDGDGVDDEFDQCDHSGWDEVEGVPIVEENGCTCFENNNNSTGIDSDGDGYGSCVDPCPDAYGWIDGC